jgi:multisubunit Na+/H+ antiporter MnhB subunit
LAEPFDFLLVLTLLVLAWQGLRASDLFTGIVLFMLFGLLTALAWVRLAAPDVALAEAAIGAGLTGALFLGALGRMQAQGSAEQVPPAPGPSPLLGGVVSLAVLGWAAILCWSAWQVPQTSPGLGWLVDGELSHTGVSNRVTAVILNFRGYDTLLEMGVLFLAAIGVFALYDSDRTSRRFAMPAAGPVLLSFTRTLVPTMVLVAGYLLWVGAHAPGGAFQAGAVLAAVGVVLLLAGAGLSFDAETAWRRWLASIGFLLFLGIGLGVMGWGRPFLSYPPERAKHLVLAIEIAATLSIAFILAALFAGCAALLSGGKPEGDYAGETEP